MRARSWAQSMRLDRDRGEAARGPVGAGFRAWPGDVGDSASTGESSGSGRPIEITVDLRRALGARTPW